MTEANLAVNFFVALFALIDPIGNVPLFAAATLGAAAAGRRMVAVYIGLFMATFLVFFYFTGVGLLAFFGISMPAFRIAGGIILFILGLDMVRDDFTTMFADAAEGIEGQSPRVYAKARFERLIVPFAMPLLIGPGSISTVIIYAAEAKEFGAAGMGIGVGVIAAVSLVTVLTFWASPLISKALGRIGMSIVVRVLGLILCALAVQFVMVGVADATRGLVRQDAKAPYAESK
jgi:multiple antibiotic resistance protein